MRTNDKNHKKLPLLCTALWEITFPQQHTQKSQLLLFFLVIKTLLDLVSVHCGYMTSKCRWLCIFFCKMNGFSSFFVTFKHSHQKLSVFLKTVIYLIN